MVNFKLFQRPKTSTISRLLSLRLGLIKCVLTKSERGFYYDIFATMAREVDDWKKVGLETLRGLNKFIDEVKMITSLIDTNTVNIGDNIITLNSDETGSPTQDAGIEVERGTGANKSLIWDDNHNYTLQDQN